MTPLPPWIFVIASALVLIWNVALAARIARLRRAPRSLRSLSALAGLLLAPAVLIVLSTSSIITGRALLELTWLWPATVALFAIQSVLVLVRRMVSPLLGAPIVLYNVLLLGATGARWMVSIGAPAGDAWLALDAAWANALGLILGRAALWSAYALPLPLLAPVAPARWRASATMRGLVALSAACAGGLVLAELPPSWLAIRSYAELSQARLQERPRGDFVIGLRALPALRGAPPAVALRHDLALLDSTDAGAVSVLVDPAGVRSRAGLDSLARTLAQLRRDSLLLVVTLGYDANDGEAWRASPQAYAESRVDLVERLARSIRPDILLPADDPYTSGRRALGDVPVAWWTSYLTAASERARGINGRIRIGVAISAFSPGDSALYAWASAPGSPVNVVGFSFFPSYGGGRSVTARLRTAGRWMRDTRKSHWVFAAGGFPMSHGERSQTAAVWGTLAWATRQPSVHGVIVDGAGDYEAMTGLRAAGGRLRPTASLVARAVVTLGETPP